MTQEEQKLEEKKLAVKKFLHSVKSAIMAMDIETLKEEQLISVFDNFVALIDATVPEDSSAS